MLKGVEKTLEAKYKLVTIVNKMDRRHKKCEHLQFTECIVFTYLFHLSSGRVNISGSCHFRGSFDGICGFLRFLVYRSADYQNRDIYLT